MKVPQGVNIVLKKISKMQIGAFAANASFFLVLSVFPAMLLILGMLQYTPLDAADLLAAISAVVPESLLPLFTYMVQNVFSTGNFTIVSISAVTLLWSSSRGVYGLVQGLNRIYQAPENRSYLYLRGISLLYTFFLMISLLLTLVLYVFSSRILHMISTKDNFWSNLFAQVIPVRTILLLTVLTFLFAAIFMVLPNKKTRFYEALPGALFSAIGWQIFSFLFSVYVDYFSNYSAIYGSLSMVALAMLWLYFCMCIVFYGGAMNHLLLDARKKEIE